MVGGAGAGWPTWLCCPSKESPKVSETGGEQCPMACEPMEWIIVAANGLHPPNTSTATRRKLPPTLWQMAAWRACLQDSGPSCGWPLHPPPSVPAERWLWCPGPQVDRHSTPLGKKYIGRSSTGPWNQGRHLLLRCQGGRLSSSEKDVVEGVVAANKIPLPTTPNLVVTSTIWWGGTDWTRGGTTAGRDS